MKIDMVPDEFNPVVLLVVRGADLLGTVMDEGDWGQARGRYAAWSSKCRKPRGTVGFFDSPEQARDAVAALWPEEAPATSDDAPAAEGLAADAGPQRRTLKGLAAPFQVYAVEKSAGRFWARGETSGPIGVLLTVARTEVRHGCRYGYTEDGREIEFFGVASKVWVRLIGADC